MSILLLVALKELLNSIEEFVLEIGLFPVSLESVSTSLIKLLFQKNFPIDDDVILLLAVGDSATQVSLLSRKQSVVLMSYTLGIGSGFFVRGIQNYRTASYAEAMQAFVNIKKEDSELIQLVHTLFSEFQKEVAKVILTSQDKLGIKPSKMVIYGEASNALEILSQTSQAEMPPIYQLTLSALIEKKFFTASKKEIAQRNDALPTLSSCL